MKKIKYSSTINEYIKIYNIDRYFNNDSILKYLEIIFFEKGEYICKEGYEVDYLFFLIKGKAKVYTTLKNGKNMLVCFYNPLRIIGEVEIIKLEAAISTIQTIEESYCIAISTKNVKEILMKDINFINLLCESLSDKLKRLSKNSSINLSYPLENRLASFIIASKVTEYREQGKVLIFNENLTEVAEILGTSYRHLLRSLKTLCEKNFLKKTKGLYEILNYDEIVKISSDLYR